MEIPAQTENEFDGVEILQESPEAAEERRRREENALKRISFPPPPNTDPFEEDRHIAAAKIQAITRGALARKHSRELREKKLFEKRVLAVTCIQRYLRGMIGRKEAQRRREEKAALLLQRHTRGFLARKQYTKAKNLIKTEEYIRQREIEHAQIRGQVWIPETHSVGKVVPTPLALEKARQIEEQLTRRGKQDKAQQEGKKSRGPSEEWRANRRFSGQVAPADLPSPPSSQTSERGSSSSSSDSEKESDGGDHMGGGQVKTGINARKALFDQQRLDRGSADSTEDEVGALESSRVSKLPKGPKWRKFSLDLTDYSQSAQRSSSTDFPSLDGAAPGRLEGDYEEEFGFC